MRSERFDPCCTPYASRQKDVSTAIAQRHTFPKISLTPDLYWHKKVQGHQDISVFIGDLKRQMFK